MDFLEKAFDYQDGRPSENRITHPIPEMPLMIDGNEINPGSIVEYEGDPLHTVYDQEYRDGECIRMYTSEKGARDRIEQLREKPDTLWPSLEGQRTLNENQADAALNPVRPSGFLDMYEHKHLGGCQWTIRGAPVSAEEASKGRDFTKFMSCGFLFWGWKNANDQITSLDCKFYDSSGLSFYEHTNYDGNSFEVPAISPNGYGMRVEELKYWNDRISSVSIRGIWK